MSPWRAWASQPKCEHCKHRVCTCVEVLNEDGRVIGRAIPYGPALSLVGPHSSNEDPGLERGNAG